MCTFNFGIKKRYYLYNAYKGSIDIYKKSTASRLERLPQGHPYKEPRALVFEATHRKPESTRVAGRAGSCAKEVKVTGSSATYRTRPIAAVCTLMDKRTIDTRTDTRRG
jgi:hypothetical protein